MNTNELARSSTCAKIAQIAADGKLRQMDIYNLDMKDWLAHLEQLIAGKKKP